MVRFLKFNVSKSSFERWWTTIGTYLVILAIALIGGGFAELWETLRLFFTFNQAELIREGSNPLAAIPVAASLLVVDLPVALAIAYIVHSLPKVRLGSLTHSLADATNSINSKGSDSKAKDDGSHAIFAKYFSVIFLEEVFARWLFLGVVYWLFSLIPSPLVHSIAFYLLFLAGNTLWALAHLGNYEKRFGRSVLWVLPQFVGGIGLTIIYWRYGFWVALLTHFAYDAMIWCYDKTQEFDRVDLWHVGISGLYAIVFYLLLDHQPSDLLPWFESATVAPYKSYGMWEFVQLALFFQGIAGVFFGVLLYDHAGGEKQASTQGLLPLGLGKAIGAVLGCYFTYWVLRGITGGGSITVLIYALLRTFGSRDTSLNAMCRTFWSSVPFAAIIVCSIQSLSFWGAVWFIFWTGLLLLPLNMSEHFARQR